MATKPSLAQRIRDIQVELDEMRKHDNSLMAVILRAIREEVEALTRPPDIDWVEHYIERRHRGVHELTSLVEALEVFDCGSIGGFGVYKGKQAPGNMSLLQRAEWLLTKYEPQK